MHVLGGRLPPCKEFENSGDLVSHLGIPIAPPESSRLLSVCKDSNGFVESMAFPNPLRCSLHARIQAGSYSGIFQAALGNISQWTDKPTLDSSAFQWSKPNRPMCRCVLYRCRVPWVHTCTRLEHSRPGDQPSRGLLHMSMFDLGKQDQKDSLKCLLLTLAHTTQPRHDTI